MRVRGERGELKSFHAHQAASSQANGGGRARLGSLREIIQILRRDKAFARYCTAQFFLGSSNFMVDPVLTIVVTKQLGLSYFACTLLMDLLPATLMLLTMTTWAAYFDRIGVLRFRVVNSAVWVTSIACATLAMMTINVAGPALVSVAPPTPNELGTLRDLHARTKSAHSQRVRIALP